MGILPACAGSRQNPRVADEPAIKATYDRYVETSGPLGYARGIDRWVITGKDGKPLEVVFRADFLSKP